MFLMAHHFGEVSVLSHIPFKVQFTVKAFYWYSVFSSFAERLIGKSYKIIVWLVETVRIFP